MLKVGITGNIASGKSIVESLIKDKNYLVFDLDIISHKLLSENEEIKKAILDEFKTLNRGDIGKIVFSDFEKRKKLEEIIHPKLKEFCMRIFNGSEKIVFISGALLYEAGFDKLFDKIIYIDAKKEIRLERLMKRNNLSKEDALLRIESQLDNKNKADFIVENNDSIEKLEIKVNSILRELTCKL